MDDSPPVGVGTLTTGKSDVAVVGAVTGVVVPEPPVAVSEGIGKPCEVSIGFVTTIDELPPEQAVQTV